MPAARSGAGRGPAVRRGRASQDSRARPRTPDSRPAPRPARQVSPEPSTQRSRPKLTGRAVVFAVVLIVLVLSYASSLRAWLDQRSELAALDAKIAERRATVAALEEEIGRWQDPAYVRAQARERFGWVLPGEVGYRVIGADGKPLGGMPDLPVEPSAEPAHPPEDWWAGLWGSVQAAGREPEQQATPKREHAPATRIGPQRPGPTTGSPGQPP